MCPSNDLIGSASSSVPHLRNTHAPWIGVKRPATIPADAARHFICANPLQSDSQGGKGGHPRHLRMRRLSRIQKHRLRAARRVARAWRGGTWTGSVFGVVQGARMQKKSQHSSTTQRRIRQWTLFAEARTATEVGTRGRIEFLPRAARAKI